MKKKLTTTLLFFLAILLFLLVSNAGALPYAGTNDRYADVTGFTELSFGNTYFGLNSNDYGAFTDSSGNIYYNLFDDGATARWVGTWNANDTGVTNIIGQLGYTIVNSAKYESGRGLELGSDFTLDLSNEVFKESEPVAGTWSATLGTDPFDVGIFVVKGDVYASIFVGGPSDSGTWNTGYLNTAGGNTNNPKEISYFRAVSTTTPVPEPATMVLLGIGLVGLAGVKRKKFFKR